MCRGPVQTRVRPVLAASVSVSSCGPCLVDSEGLDLVSSVLSGSDTFSPSSPEGFPSSKWGGFDGGLLFSAVCSKGPRRFNFGKENNHDLDFLSRKLNKWMLYFIS